MRAFSPASDGRKDYHQYSACELQERRIQKSCGCSSQGGQRKCPNTSKCPVLSKALATFAFNANQKASAHCSGQTKRQIWVEVHVVRLEQCSGHGAVGTAYSAAGITALLAIPVRREASSWLWVRIGRHASLTEAFEVSRVRARMRTDPEASSCGSDQRGCPAAHQT